MWLGHFIEHLMCIGGELEHHKSSPTAGQKNRAVHCSARGGIYRPTIGPGLWLKPGLKVPNWSWCQPQTGTNGCGPGTRRIGPSLCMEPGPKGSPLVPVPATNRDQWLWARSKAHWSRFVSGTGTKGVRPMAHEARPAPWPHEPGPMPP